jgi:hypothetical protein
MFSRIRRIALGLLVPVVFAGAAHAQGHPPYRPHIGAHLSYNFKAEELGIGPQLYIPVAHRFEVYPSFDYYFVDNGSLWQLNGDLKFKGREEHSWWYLGAGLAVSRASFGGFHNTDVGANVLGGLETLIGQKVHPYFEARLTFRDNTVFQLAGGLNITIY